MDVCTAKFSLHCSNTFCHSMLGTVIVLSFCVNYYCIVGYSMRSCSAALSLMLSQCAIFHAQ